MFSADVIDCEAVIELVNDQNYGPCFLFSNPTNFSQIIGGNGLVIMIKDLTESLPGYPKFNTGFQVPYQLIPAFVYMFLVLISNSNCFKLKFFFEETKTGSFYACTTNFILDYFTLQRTF